LVLLPLARKKILEHLGVRAEPLPTRQRNPQMVIMGSHARTGPARAVFGSVAESVLRQSTIPVLIEPAGRHLEEHPSEVIVQAEAEQCG
jgi:nucleotide-binding universal stress UspA family protein